MKKRTYRRKLTYVPHTCSDGTAYWSLYIGHRYVKHCGSNAEVIANRRWIAGFENWTRIAYRYWSY